MLWGSYMRAQCVLWAGCSFWSMHTLWESGGAGGAGELLLYALMTFNIASHFEYALHRFALHGAFAAVHAQHHALPNKRARMHTPVICVVAVIAMAYGCIVAVAPCKMRAVSLVVGPLYYLGFEFRHAATHRPGTCAGSTRVALATISSITCHPP
jgi:hypothetical protein